MLRRNGDCSVCFYMTVPVTAYIVCNAAACVVLMCTVICDDVIIHVRTCSYTSLMRKVQ